MVRDARGVPEFVFNPRKGETMQEAFDLKGNPSVDRDWWHTKYASTGEAYTFGVAHWALTEGRFRKHLKAITEAEAATLVPMHDQLAFVTQEDVTYRRVFDEGHRSHIPNFGCYIKVERKGAFAYYAVTRQMVLFAVERRKAWRMLQSKAGIVNKDYLAQRALLGRIDSGALSVTEAKANLSTLLAELTA